MLLFGNQNTSISCLTVGSEDGSAVVYLNPIFYKVGLSIQKTYKQSAKLLLCCVNIIQRGVFITAVGQGSFLFPIKEKDRFHQLLTTGQSNSVSKQLENH